MATRKKSFEEYLIEHRLITPEKSKQISEECKKSGESFRERVISQGLIPSSELLNFYQHELGISYIELSKLVLDPKLLEILPQEFLRTHHVFPLSKGLDFLRVAMADPLDIMLIDEIKLKTGLKVEVVFAFKSEILQALDRSFGPVSSIDELIQSTDLSQFLVEEEVDISRLKMLAEEAPIVKLIDLILMQAVREGASDIHVEPEESAVRVRYRIDGILQEVSALPKHLQPALISRTKIMSDMDIAEKRIPQDGRFKIFTGGGAVDVRASTFPTIYGENVVLRLLQTRSLLLTLEQLGLSGAPLKKFNDLIRRPYGIILVTGPTGSGKTTTLYSVLNLLNTAEKNIITVEDPVEYRLPGIRQSQVNIKAGLTFTTGLRSILRQDPDIILVGEIRDLETAEISIHAALTGHLVFSTLHTNDAAGAVTRLVDMGAEPYLLVSSLIGVVAQRLVRQICPSCKRKGCAECHQSGYRGRMGIFEVLPMSDKIRNGILEKVSSLELAQIAQKEGMQTLKEDGQEKVSAGITTLEEVLRVTAEA